MQDSLNPDEAPAPCTSPAAPAGAASESSALSAASAAPSAAAAAAQLGSACGCHPPPRVAPGAGLSPSSPDRSCEAPPPLYRHAPRRIAAPARSLQQLLAAPPLPPLRLDLLPPPQPRRGPAKLDRRGAVSTDVRCIVGSDPPQTARSTGEEKRLLRDAEEAQEPQRKRRKEGDEGAAAGGGAVSPEQLRSSGEDFLADFFELQQGQPQGLELVDTFAAATASSAAPARLLLPPPRPSAAAKRPSELPAPSSAPSPCAAAPPAGLASRPRLQRGDREREAAASAEEAPASAASSLLSLLQRQVAQRSVAAPSAVLKQQLQEEEADLSLLPPLPLLHRQLYRALEPQSPAPCARGASKPAQAGPVSDGEPAPPAGAPPFACEPRLRRKLLRCTRRSLLTPGACLLSASGAGSRWKIYRNFLYVKSRLAGVATGEVPLDPDGLSADRVSFAPGPGGAGEPRRRGLPADHAASSLALSSGSLLPPGAAASSTLPLLQSAARRVRLSQKYRQAAVRLSRDGREAAIDAGCGTVLATHGCVEGSFFFEVKIQSLARVPEAACGTGRRGEEPEPRLHRDVQRERAAERERRRKAKSEIRVGWATRQQPPSCPLGATVHSVGFRVVGEETDRGGAEEARLPGGVAWGGSEVAYGLRAREGDVVGCFIRLVPQRAAARVEAGAGDAPSERFSATDVYAVRTLADMDSLSQGFFRYASVSQPPRVSPAFPAAPCAAAASPWSCGSFVQFSLNGRPQGLCVFNGGSDYLLSAGEYFPAISLLNGGACTVNFGPSFLFPPPPATPASAPFLPACLLPVPRLPPLTVDVLPFLVSQASFFLDRPAKLLRPKTLADIFEDLWLAPAAPPNARTAEARSERPRGAAPDDALAQVVRRLAIPSAHLAQLRAGFRKRREFEGLLESLSGHATLRLLHACALFVLHAHRLTCAKRRQRDAGAAETASEAEATRARATQPAAAAAAAAAPRRRGGGDTTAQAEAKGASRGLEGESPAETQGEEAEAPRQQEEHSEAQGEREGAFTQEQNTRKHVEHTARQVQDPANKRRRKSRMWTRWRFGGVESSEGEWAEGSLSAASSDLSSVSSDSDFSEDERAETENPSSTSPRPGAAANPTLQKKTPAVETSSSPACALCEVASSATVPQIDLTDPAAAFPSFFLPRAAFLSPLLLAFLEREEGKWAPVDADLLFRLERLHHLRAKRRTAAAAPAPAPTSGGPGESPPASTAASGGGAGACAGERALEKRGGGGAKRGRGTERKKEERSSADLAAVRRFWGGHVYAPEDRETIQVGNVSLEVPSFWLSGDAEDGDLEADGQEEERSEEKDRARASSGAVGATAAAREKRREMRSKTCKTSAARRSGKNASSAPSGAPLSETEQESLRLLRAVVEDALDSSAAFAGRDEDDGERATRQADCLMRKLGLSAVQILEGLGAKLQVYEHQSGLCQALVRWRQASAKAQGFLAEEVKELACRFWLGQHASLLPL
ncbi:hypothetical protein BESB_027290 [Besnoitia besnoiti]|uniref:SPRY domain-containing protein n=1 Tax=Besnoitia besnoiti TaxID=94643 RepID=A0A2A9M224_BESBE|nr:uncharacterized protein BESB_027290 [Besnoitia besnoiti]PFH31294.1 hypothetical protein BESB_027290 [Besnoitia besnoiti]